MSIDNVLLSQVSTYLTSSQIAKLNNVVEVFYKYSEDLQSRMQLILRNALFELEDKDINIKKAEKLFNETVMKATESLYQIVSDAYQEQLKTGDIFLYNGAIVLHILSLLEQILEFEQTIDKFYPGASKQIINRLENILVGIIATQLPIIAVFIKASGILEKIKDLTSSKYLLPKVQKWRDDIVQMQDKLKNSKKLGPIYEKAEKVAQLAEKVDLAPSKLAKLNLSDKLLDEANQIEVFNKKEKSAFKAVVEATETLLRQPETIIKTISKLNKDLAHSISSVMNLDKLESVIKHNLDQVKEELLKTINPEISFSERVLSLCKTVENVSKIALEIKNIVGVTKIIPSLDEVIQKAIEAIVPPQIITLKDLAPTVLKLVGIGKVILEQVSKVFKNTENLSQSKVRTQG